MLFKRVRLHISFKRSFIIHNNDKIIFFFWADQFINQTVQSQSVLLERKVSEGPIVGHNQ